MPEISGLIDFMRGGCMCKRVWLRFLWFSLLVAAVVSARLLSPAAPAVAQSSPLLFLEDAQVVEGNSGTISLVFTARLTATTSQTVTALFSAIAPGGSLGATGGSSCSADGVDFLTVTNRQISIAPNTLSTTTSVTICGDTRDEGNELILGSLQSPTNASCRSTEACARAGTIQDDDPIVSIGPDVTVSEAAGTVTLTVTLSAASDRPVPFSFSTADGTAVGLDACGGAADFPQVTSGSGSVSAGASSGSFTVAICDDNRDEPSQNFVVNLTSASAGLGDSQATVTITDNDPLPVITVADTSVDEDPDCSSRVPCLAASLAIFRVTLSAPSDRTVTVNYATSNGSASGGPDCSSNTTDFVSETGSLTFDPGDASKSIVIMICGDDFFGQDETFLVTLSSPVNASCTTKGADCQAQGTILNDDASTTGAFVLTPQDSTAEALALVATTLTWKVPEGRAWRALDTIDLQIGDESDTLLWVRWDEAGNKFSLCEGRRDGGVRCNGGAAPGSPQVLAARGVQLHLDETSVVGSGPTGPSVTLSFGLRFEPAAAGRTYQIEVAATDDLGHQDEFLPAGTLQVVQ